MWYILWVHVVKYLRKYLRKIKSDMHISHWCLVGHSHSDNFDALAIINMQIIILAFTSVDLPNHADY